MAGDWTDAQNDAIVADYFAMLADDVAGRPYNKAEHNRLLQAVIGRPRASNINRSPEPALEAILLGRDPGLLPRSLGDCENAMSSACAEHRQSAFRCIAFAKF